MQIIFLGGGEGKRMKPLKTDKATIPFLGKLSFYHILKQFKEVGGFDSIVIVANERNKEELEGVAKELEVEAKIVIQEKPLGMADSVLTAKEYIKGEVLISNTEDFFENSALEGVLEKAKGGADIVFAGLEVEKYFSGGYLKLEGEKVLGIVEKPGEGNEPSNVTKLVLDYFKDGEGFVKALEEASSDKDDVYEVALDKLINSGLKAEVSKYKGYWTPIKYSWHLLDVASFLLKSIQKNISPEAKIASNAVIEGEVVIEEGVRVFEGAVIKGPAFIGKGTIIGNNALVRESMIEENSAVGSYTEVARSYIGPHSWFHKNYIGDSVIEGNFEAGSGAITANLRLDGKEIKVGDQRIDSGKSKLGVIAGEGVRIGANSTTQPGVRIGADSLIGSGVVVSRDVPEKTKLTVKQEYEISEFGGDDTDYSKFKDNLK